MRKFNYLIFLLIVQTFNYAQQKVQDTIKLDKVENVNLDIWSLTNGNSIRSDRLELIDSVGINYFLGYSDNKFVCCMHDHTTF